MKRHSTINIMQELHINNSDNTNDDNNKTKNNSNLSDNLKIFQKNLCQQIIELHQHHLSLGVLVDDGDENNNNNDIDGEKQAVVPAVPSSKVSSIVTTANELLGPIIHAAFANDVSAVPGDDVDDTTTTTTTSGTDDGITPLMVACDKDHVKLPCLKYFASLYSNVCKRNQTKQKELLDKLLGHCLCSSATDGHNQAIHYAALSLPETALEYLAQIFQCQQAQPLPQQEKERSSRYSFQKACLVLLSQVNDHGDTPLMLAAANGKRSTIEHWIQLLLSKPSHGNDGNDNNTGDDNYNDDDGNYEINKKAVVNLLSQRNKSNDTVLSLAYGYGHYDIVECLIGGIQHCNKQQPQQEVTAHTFVPVQYQDVQQCKALLEKLNVMMEQQQVDKVNMDEFQRRKKNIQACYDLLLEALTKQADQAVSSLLLEEDLGGEDSQCNKIQHHGNKKKIVAKQKNLSYKKKKKKSRNDASVVVTAEDKDKSTSTASCTNDERISQQQTDGMVEESMPITTSTFVTMSDGTVVSCQQYLQSSSSLSWSSKPMIESTCTKSSFTSTTTTTTTATSNSNRTKSINHLLRDRCNDTWNRESEELMEALCLDASMLLLSPQSMALNLSPSQLETVETVLNLQLKAVETAKTIHARLMSTK